jgi:hypothetical protein
MSPRDEVSIDVSDIAPVHLELETSRSHDLVGPYGAFVATMAPPHLASQAWRAPPYAVAGSTWREYSAPKTRAGAAAERVIDAFAALPFGLWSRVAFYAFLFFFLGNVFRCGGLTLMTDVACSLLVVLGLVGMVACAQRNP